MGGDNDDTRSDATSENVLAEIIPGLWIGSLGSVRVCSKDEEATNNTRTPASHWTIISIIESDRLLRLCRLLLDEKIASGICRHEIWKLRDKANSNFLSSELSSILNVIDDVMTQRNDDISLIGQTSSTETVTRKQQHCCLVHCAQGKSRSAAVCAAWLISRKGLSLQDAMAKIRIVRPEIRPNLGFLAALRAIEQTGGNLETAKQRMGQSNS